MEIPVFLVTGFLESGKSSFIIETLKDEEFSSGEKTLLICLEEGEVEYDEDFLVSKNVTLVTVDEKEDFTVFPDSSGSALLYALRGRFCFCGKTAGGYDPELPAL